MSEIGMCDSLAGYGRYLNYMLGLQRRYGPAQQRIASLIGLPERPVSLEDSLRRDLVSTGTNSVGHSAEKPGDTESLPTGDNRSADWGVAYVMEGSALGGRYLLSSAQKKLPAHATTCYLQQLSDDASHRWPVFVEQLELQESLDFDLAIIAAKEVFQFALTS